MYFFKKICGASHNCFNFIYIYKIKIRNSEIYLPEVSVSSTMGYSESEMKAEGEGQCAEVGGNCEGQMQTVSICYSCLFATLLAMCLVLWPHQGVANPAMKTY